MTSVPSSPSLLTAWNYSFLASLPSDIREQVFDGARTVIVAKGESMYDAYGPPRLALIHYGQARVKSTSADGRAATVRYAGGGQFIGLPSTITGAAPVGVEAVVQSEVTMFNPYHFRALASRHLPLAWLVAQELAQMSYESKEFLGNSIFGSVEQRVARHLLELATRTEEGLVVAVGQNDIADSIGSVREVVARAIRHLREMGCIERKAGHIVITDPARLHEIAGK